MLSWRCRSPRDANVRWHRVPSHCREEIAAHRRRFREVLFGRFAGNINFGWGWGSNAPELVVALYGEDAATGRAEWDIAVAPWHNAYDLNLISSSGMSNAIKPGLPIELTLEASTHDGKLFESTFPMKVTTYKMDWSDKSVSLSGDDLSRRAMARELGKVYCERARAGPVAGRMI